MIRILYKTHQGNMKVKEVHTRDDAANMLGKLWQARIKAKAYDHAKKVGGVHRVDGVLTWWCEGHNFDGNKCS